MLHSFFVFLLYVLTKNLYLCGLNYSSSSTMKKLIITLLILVAAKFSFASGLFFDSFEYVNHDLQSPAGWICEDDSWLAGYLQKDHNRVAHTGNWYAFTNGSESWMFMSSYMSQDLKFRFTVWAISDGEYQLEIWGGNSAESSAMTQLFVSENVNSGNYVKVSAYIEEMLGNYEYFGIHAVPVNGGSMLTIDDVSVDIINQYDFHASPSQIDTVMQPGAQAVFNWKMINEGYEDVTIYMSAHSSHFTDVHFYVDGAMTTHFFLPHGGMVPVRGVATLSPDMEPGSTNWVDIMFTIDCGCATAMFTLWATAADDGIEENHVNPINIYPNPSKGQITIEGTGSYSVFNSLGQEVLRRNIAGKETVELPKGVYFIRKDDKATEKIIVE